MHELPPTQSESGEPISIPERELLGFVTAVDGLFGPGQTRFLKEIWLDELASMDTMPDPASPLWRVVTVNAWARFAWRRFDLPLTIDCI